jgi:hypothetical protein
MHRMLCMRKSKYVTPQQRMAEQSHLYTWPDCKVLSLLCIWVWFSIELPVYKEFVWEKPHTEWYTETLIPCSLIGCWGSPNVTFHISTWKSINSVLNCIHLSFPSLMVKLAAAKQILSWDFTIINTHSTYVGYSESKYRLRVSPTLPRDCPFEHVQWLPLSNEKPQTPFREIRVTFMFVPVR